MKHIFVINPAAGKGERLVDIEQEIHAAAVKTGVEYEIHFTDAVGDAERFVKEKASSGEVFRFYACGGDGTLNEIVNGAFGFNNVEVACIPNGTGNDFIRNYADVSGFTDIERQLAGVSSEVDLLQYNDRFCINMINIGLDGDVASKTAEVKRKTPFKGTMAYIVSLVIIFFKKFGVGLDLVFENGKKISDDYLLVAVANGAFCGGGFKAGAEARLDDGNMDICVVHKISRFRVPGLIGKYKAGKHLKSKACMRFVEYYRDKSITVRAHKPKTVSVDGEMVHLTEMHIRIIPKALKFSVPCGCRLESTQRVEAAF